MTTNKERAEKAIQELTGTGELGKNAAQAIAQALADAGLLMPDLPEPKWPGLWEVDGLEINSVDKDGEVRIEWDEESDYAYYGTQTRTLWLNRDQVIAILAAANHAEKEQEND